ncbi:MAG TPA: peptidoglycan-binding protein, partial [Burkholderiales bacterium]|nr:peptidoglycan-binding protein [Burkholderiales bacterium]
MQRKNILAAGLAALTLAWSQAGFAQQAGTDSEAGVAAMLARLAEQEQAWLDAAQADPSAPLASHLAVPAKPLRKGSKGADVALLCNALEARGFVPCAPRQDTVDAALASRIATAQRYYGLAADGLADSQLYNALALSAAERAARIDALISEWEGIRAKAREMGADKYLVVNVPAFEVKAVTNDSLALTSRTIVGRPERQTPLGVINIRAIKF